MTTFTACSPFVCGWETTPCCDRLIGADPEQAQTWVDSAAEILYALSGRQFGLCVNIVRPCRPRPDLRVGGMGGFRWTPLLDGGQWINVSCGQHSSCSCTELCEVVLPGPADTITEVKLDGQVLTCGVDYRLDSGNRLVATGNFCWPECQDMALDDDQPGTWSVTYLRGLPLPESGKLALGEFACEIAKACLGDEECALNSRVTNITRQGVTMTMLDPLSFIEEGRTGIYLVDAWLRAVNPKGRSRSAGIYSPDVEQPRFTV